MSSAGVWMERGRNSSKRWW